MLNTLTTSRPRSPQRDHCDARTRAIAAFLERLPGASTIDAAHFERTMRAVAREATLALADRHPGLVVHTVYVITLAAMLNLDLRHDLARLDALTRMLSAHLRPTLEATTARPRRRADRSEVPNVGR